MPYNIIVCIKQVPHPEYLGKISLDRATGTTNREGVPAVINPVDRNALEAALGIRDRFSGRVTVVTMGPPQAKRALEEALAMDVDAAIHLCDTAFAGADTLATARALACALRKLEPFDLVFCGEATIDSGTAQVPVQLAELLGLPAIISVEELSFENEQTLLVKKIWERGYIKLRVLLSEGPVIITVTNKINQPRLATVAGIMAATQKEIKKWGAADIGAEPALMGLKGSPTQVNEICELKVARHGEILEGTPEEVVNEAIERLRRLEIL
jgi:electron transfer flavoprotein beta subunit